MKRWRNFSYENIFALRENRETLGGKTREIQDWELNLETLDFKKLFVEKENRKIRKILS